MTFTKESSFNIDVKELAHMISHKCEYCKFKEARCSEKNGCEEGVFEFLSDLKDN